MAAKTSEVFGKGREVKQKWVLFLMLFAVACAGIEPEPSVGENTAVLEAPERPPTSEPLETHLPQPSPSPTPIDNAPTSPASVSPLDPTSSSAATPYVEIDPPIALGQPQMVGRGQMLEAAIDNSGTFAAIAWASGVSYLMVDGAVELWYQPLPYSPIALDLRADGEEIAVGLSNGSVSLLDSEGSAARSFTVAQDNAYWGDIAYSPNGNTVAVQMIGPRRDDPIFLLDRASGFVGEVPESQGDEGTRPYLVWSPDGSRITLARLTPDCSQILDVETGESVFSFANDETCYAPYSVAWSPDGRLLALDNGQGIDVIDFSTQTVQQTFSGPILSFGLAANGDALFFSPDGRRLVSRGGVSFYNDSYPMLVWDIVSGSEVAQLTSVSLSPRQSATVLTDGSIVSIYSDGTIGHWTPGVSEDVLGRQPVLPVRFPFSMSPNGSRIGAPSDHQYAVWDVKSGETLIVFDTLFDSVIFSPNGRFLALLNRTEQTLTLFDFEQEEVVETLPNVTSAGDGVGFSPKGNLLIFGSGNEAIVYDVESSSEVARLVGYPSTQTVAKVEWSPAENSVLVATAAADGGDTPGTIILWRQTQMNQFSELFRAENVRAGYGVHGRPIALFNSDGTYIAIENLPINDANEFTIFVYDLVQEQVAFDTRDYQLSAWLDNKTVLTSQAQFDTNLTAWHVESGQPTVGQGFDNGGLAFTPTGGFYATQDSSGLDIGRGVDVYHWQTGELLINAPTRGDVMMLGWGTNGRLLAASDTNGLLIVWPVIYRE